MEEFPLIISVDDHVVEPPRMFLDRLPRKYHEVGPRVVRAHFAEPETGEAVTAQHTGLAPTDEGLPCDWWFYEDVRVPIMQANATAGTAFNGTNNPITFDDMKPGFYDPKARLADMDVNGVQASLCFPNIIPRFCGQQFLWGKDRELALLCVQAYNDWMIDEWCGDSGGRLIPLCIIPLWDAELAAAEVRRNADRGCRAVAFSELPGVLDLPSIHDRDRYWDPFFRACDETRTVICMHIGSSSKLPYTSPDAPLSVAATLLSTNSMKSFIDWLFCGAFDRFPNLKIAYSEGNIGWIPYMLERAERTWDVHDWTLAGRRVEQRPTEYFRERIFGCFIADEFGAANIESVGVDNVTFEVDYPHADTTWPNSVAVAKRELGHLSPEDITKVVRGNAIKLFGLEHLDGVPAR